MTRLEPQKQSVAWSPPGSAPNSYTGIRFISEFKDTATEFQTLRHPRHRGTRFHPRRSVRATEAQLDRASVTQGTRGTRTALGRLFSAVPLRDQEPGDTEDLGH
ncbi:hypothetical protein MDA_GLEAN10025860 [Myotis davidii]|uniref:Uncharacterized protein n=1 Tax=Myotis davidii TaxID=225400 RepID=L5LYR7_MYODS|nr:hypothetical protein MDA_GLEAN10025860 [Myotis davidii]